MNQEIKFKKWRILLGVAVLLFLLTVSISFILAPENFLRNKYSSTVYIQIIGVFMAVFSVSQIVSYVLILNRTNAIIITDKCLIDRSKYESLGEINWSDISKISRLKKNTIQVHLSEAYLKRNSMNPYKVFLRMMTNWNYKGSIIISSTFLHIGIDELYMVISNTHKKKKNYTQH